MIELSKSDKIALSIVLVLILAGIWIVIPILGQEISILEKIFPTIVIALFLYLIVTKKTLSPPKARSKLERGYNIYAGWHRKLISIGLKVVAVVFAIVGIYVIIKQGQYWGLGFVIIALAPMLWYLSNQAKERSKEFFEANK